MKMNVFQLTDFTHEEYRISVFENQFLIFNIQKKIENILRDISG
jgi:hypothetical protein